MIVLFMYLSYFHLKEFPFLSYSDSRFLYLYDHANVTMQKCLYMIDNRSELASPDAIGELARTQAALLHERLAELEAIETRFRNRPDLAHRLAPLRLGLRIYRTAIDFGLEIAMNPP